MSQSFVCNDCGISTDPGVTCCEKCTIERTLSGEATTSTPGVEDRIKDYLAELSYGKMVFSGLSEEDMKQIEGRIKAWLRSKYQEKYEDSVLTMGDFSHELIASRIVRKLPEKRKGVKINRNSPCTCGSGLKFKKCCINK